jgi:hypothetical protein
MADSAFSLAHTTTNESTVKGQPKPSSQNYAVNFQGAIGYPIFKKDKLISGQDPPGKETSLYVNLIPYAAIDRESKKDTATGATDTQPAKVSANRSELGVVGFLYTDKQPENCFIRKLSHALEDLQSCASYLVVRVEELHDSVAHSRLDAATVRYVPLVKTASKGLGALDICINTVCGDPNRILRMGVLADARLDFGDFVNPGDDVDLQRFNKDYARIGGRIGFLGDVTFLPDAPIHFWTAWTDVHPLRGYNQDLSEVQAQASFNFSAATLSLAWRNGRREDTAQRDNAWKIMIGFKSK